MIIHNQPKNIVIKKTPGAPKGLKWHWFRWHFLRSKLKLYFELIYDYTMDSYVLVRLGHRDDFTKKTGISRRYDWEIFSVTRTSKQCYRCMYTDVLMGTCKIFRSAIAGEIA